MPDDEALKAVSLDGLMRFMRPGAIHVSMSTVSPGLSRLLDAEHEARGQGYVAAPVLGNPDLTRARHLFVLAAGRPTALDRVRALLESLGQRCLSSATTPLRRTSKLAGNALSATTLQGMGEVLALLRKGESSSTSLSTTSKIFRNRIGRVRRAMTELR